MDEAAMTAIKEGEQVQEAGDSNQKAEKNKHSIFVANEKFLQRAGLFQDMVREVQTASLEFQDSTTQDKFSGFQSFAQAKYTNPFISRDELLSTVAVDLTPEEEMLLAEALDKERPLRELECLERERQLQRQVAVLQNELVLAKQPPEDMVKQLLQEMQTKLDVAQAEHDHLTESVETLQNSNADLQMSREKLQKVVEQRLQVSVGAGDFKSKVVMVVGITFLSQRVVELLAEAGTCHVVLVDPTGPVAEQESAPAAAAHATEMLYEPAEFVKQLNASSLHRAQDSVFEVTVKALPSNDHDVSRLAQVIGEVKPDLLLFLSTPELIVGCNEACLLSKQPWVCASANGFSWYMHLLCPGDTACMDCEPEDYEPTVNDKLNHLQGFSKSANIQCVASLVVETAIRYLNGGETRFCSISLVNGVSSSRSMFPNPECISPECQCLQDDLEVGA